MPLINADTASSPDRPIIQRHVIMEFRVAVDTAESTKVPARPHHSLINPNSIRILGQDDVVDTSVLPHVRQAWLSSLEAAMEQPTHIRDKAGKTIEEIAHAVSVKLDATIKTAGLIERVQSMIFPVPEIYRVDLPFPKTALGLREEIMEKLIPFVGVRDALKRFEGTLDLPIRALTLRHFKPENPIITTQ